MAAIDGIPELYRAILRTRGDAVALGPTMLLANYLIHNHDASQICTVLSSLPEAMYLPLGDHTAEFTLSECP